MFISDSCFVHNGRVYQFEGRMVILKICNSPIFRISILLYSGSVRAIYLLRLNFLFFLVIYVLPLWCPHTVKQ